MSDISSTELNARLGFLQTIEGLKKTLRSAHLSNGRVESTAEHTWRLCLWVMVFVDQLEEIDTEHLFKMLLIHDLGETISGDIPAPLQRGRDQKHAQERADIEMLIAPLPKAMQTSILGLWEEYEAAQTPEAIIAKGFDKLETIMQHNQGANPDGFDYDFNLDYGVEHTKRHPLLAAIREILDDATRAKSTYHKGCQSPQAGLDDQ